MTFAETSLGGVLCVDVERREDHAAFSHAPSANANLLHAALNEVDRQRNISFNTNKVSCAGCVFERLRI
jgi:hypothetical protein